MATQNLMLGDCLEWIKSLPDKYYDLAIVDPPYGIGMDGDFSCFSRNDKGFLGKKNHSKKDWDKHAPTKEYFSELFRVAKNQIIWGANYYPNFLNCSMGWVVWDKKVSNANNKNFSDCELAYTSFDKRLVKFTYDWIGFGYINNLDNQKKIHPTEKPIALYKWLLTNYAKAGQKIFDSHGGSFSHAIAAYDLGFDLDIIEIDTDYYRDGKERYDKHVLKCEEIKQLGFAKTELNIINPTLF